MKRFLLLLVWFMSVTALFAEGIDSTYAKQVAKGFIKRNAYIQQPALDLVSVQTARDMTYIPAISTATDPLMYVFNIRGGQGFVIIAADNAVSPVLGYATEGSWTGTDIPDALAGLLDKYRLEILAVKQNNWKANDHIIACWTDYANGNTSLQASPMSVSPLIATRWNQMPYYNSLCPYDNTAGERTVTGCVATAMAQIMKFWNAPANGSGFHSYNHSTYGTLSANFGSTTYAWTSMPNSVTSSNTAVATLMYHCGVGVEMDYGIAANGGSGAYVISAASAGTHCAEYAFKTYFGYQTSIQGLMRADYSDATWIQKLKTELDNGRPMLYAGFGQGGHAFVCDGYDNSNNFHFNWGWGGLYDGYFNIDQLNPGTGGTGGGAGTYNNNQQAVMNIKPVTGGTGTALLEIYSTITIDPDPIQYASAFTANVDIHNDGTSAFIGEFAAAIFNSSSVFVEFIETKTGINLPANYHYTNGVTFSTTGLTSMTPGTYIIAFFYRTIGGNWTIIPKGAYDNAVYVDVQGPDNDIRLYDSIQITPNPVVQNKSATMYLDVANFGTTSFLGTVSVDLHELDGTWIKTIDDYEITGTGLCSMCHFTNGLTFGTTGLNDSAGSYLLVAWDQPSGGDWEIVGSGQYSNPITFRLVEPAILADPYESNNTENTCYTLTVTFSGNNAKVLTTGSNIHVGNDYDFYKINLPSGFNYTVTARVHDEQNSGDGKTYTCDVLFACNSTGSWTSTYTDIMPTNLQVNNGGIVKFYVSPYFLGKTGTYLFEINITKSNVSAISITAPVADDDWKMGTIQTITYTDNITDNVAIELFKGSVAVLMINSSTPSSGFYNWTIPTGLTPDVNYRIKVTSTSESSVYDYSGFFTISQQSTGINKQDQAFSPKIQLYPSPADKYITVNNQGGDIQFTEAVIFNSLGERVYTAHAVFWKSLHRIDVSTLPNGVYYMHLLAEEGKVVKQFVISR